ncbi:MAG: VIT domain-containing protein [Oscillatoriaceae cyanobacterium]
MKILFLLPATLLLAGSSVWAIPGGRSDGSFSYSPILASNRALSASPGTHSPIPPPSSYSQGRSLSQAPPQTGAAAPKTTSGLYVISKEGQKQVFPLRHTEVKAKIAGNLARVEVTQTFQNPFPNPLEAIYIFPLPDEAAVDDMEIKIGERIIKGEIKKREEARQIYEQAIREGRTAGLLEQERDNIFTQSLANIKPGEQIDVTIRYTESLKFIGGDYEFVFPMVVGPRYIPGNQVDEGGNTDRVPDADRISPPIVPEGQRSGQDINVTVEIDAGLPISKVNSTSHKINTTKNGNQVRVELAKEDTIPNKDLILRYQVSGNRTAATVLTEADARGGHFGVYLIPAVKYKTNEIVPKDVVFLMDTSGSQAGDPLAKSKELMRRFINGLNPQDTFTIIDFANTAQALSPSPLTNTEANRARAMSYIDALDANGGTELLNGIRTVMNYPAAQEGRLRSIVLLTDGYIGDDKEVIAEVQQKLQPGNRFYSFGVGSSVNRFLVNRLAEVGRGTARVVRQDEPTAEVAEQFFREINNPVLTNVQVQWEGGGTPPEIYPLSPPDLFAQQPLVLFGRKSDRAAGRLRVTGTAAGGERYEQVFNLNFDLGGNPAIAQLWGRHRIKDLMNQMFGRESTSGVESVTNTALAYRLLSEYTAFVAVSEEVRVNPDGTRERVVVPVEMPEGVSYDGIFESADEEAFAPGAPQGRLATGGANASVGNTNASGGTRSAYPAPTTPPPPPRPLSQAEDRAASEPEPIPTSKIEVVSAEGLDAGAIASLEQHLKYVTLPASASGEVVWELTVRGGRVVRTIWDDTASTIRDSGTLDALEQAISSWSVPGNTSGTVRIKLRIQG